MEYRILGRTGVRVSALALGTANFADPTPEDEAKQILERAVDAGINVIDTGNSYAKGEAERIIGRALKASGLRKEVLLATKVFPPTGPGPNDRGSSRLHIMQACEDSLERLQTDHIDVYFIHRFDPDTYSVRQGPLRGLFHPPRLAGDGGSGHQRSSGVSPLLL